MSALTRSEILAWLHESSPDRLCSLYSRADAVRQENVGAAVHLRGLVEISNHCVRQCMYCGLRLGNRALTRYRMTQEEILDCARQAAKLGYGTVVMQAGEDRVLTAEWIAQTVRRIKQETALAVTLSLGERAEDELRLWRTAGADRYLLRFETSDQKLFTAIHPHLFSGAPGRIELLQSLKRLGYQVGGGTMVGIPGQSYESVAADILTFQRLDLDMIGIGPYIPHAQTPLGAGKLRPHIAASEQVPATEEMVYKVLALTRIVRPDANIPSTSALATINKQSGRKQGLMAGANVVMPNLTPIKYRRLYEIYPAKACIDESAADCNECLRGQISSLGRVVGHGPGGRHDVDVPAAATSAASAQLVQLQA